MYRNIKTSNLSKILGTINIIDIRKNFLHNLGAIPGSINIPKEILEINPSRYLNKKDEYYIYCTQGTESTTLCEKLTKKGYKVINIIGGYQSYLANL